MQKKPVRQHWLVIAVLVGVSTWLALPAFQKKMLDPRLAQAVEQHDTARVRLLLALHADPNTRCEAGPPEPSRYKRFLNSLYGLPPEQKPSPYTGMDIGPTVLTVAAHDGDTEIVQSLLDNGANTEERGGSVTVLQNRAIILIAATPLLEAAQYASIVTVRVLLNHCAEINAKTDWGQTALQLAVARNDTSMALLLLAKGGDVNAHDPNGDTAVILAARNGMTSIIPLLLAHGADINAQGNAAFMNETALIAAIKNGHYDAANVLMSKRADGNRRDKFGMTALMWATRVPDDDDTVWALLTHGATVNLEDKEGRTPLMAAAAYGGPRQVRVLLAKGAGSGINVKDRRGWSALQWAKGWEDTSALLRQAGAK